MTIWLTNWSFSKLCKTYFQCFIHDFYIWMMKHFWRIKTISILNHWKWTRILFIIWTKLSTFALIADSMIQLHVHEVFWNTKSSDSTNNIEISTSRSYDSHISILTMFHMLSPIFITNIRKRKNFIIHSKLQMIEIRQNNKLDISNRYFS